MATYTVADIPLSISFDYTYSCWKCYGNMEDNVNIIEPFYDGSALFSTNRLSPTSDYED